jgi:hypothetical protein
LRLCRLAVRKAYGFPEQAFLVEGCAFNGLSRRSLDRMGGRVSERRSLSAQQSGKAA